MLQGIAPAPQALFVASLQLRLQGGVGLLQLGADRVPARLALLLAAFQAGLQFGVRSRGGGLRGLPLLRALRFMILQQ